MGNSESMPFLSVGNTAARTAGTESSDMLLTKTEENFYIKSMLEDDDSDEDPVDRPEKRRVGNKAVSDYFMHYKALKKVEEENEVFRQPNSIYTGMLSRA